MQSNIEIIYKKITEKAFPIIDFFLDYQKPIGYLVFLAAIHPTYLQFNSLKRDQQNIIKNYLTKNDSKIRYEALSNIKYEILFDFLDINQNKKIPLEIKGYIKINFDFNKDKYPKYLNFLKIDYQGNVSEIYLNDKKLDEEDYFIEKNEVKDMFVQQQKDCIFISKEKLTEINNEIYMRFNRTFIEENFNSINNPFLKLEDTDINKNRSIYV